MLNQDLDDTHLCIKCNSTIDGLENYIRHRKINCTDKTIQINRDIVHEDHAYYEFSVPQPKDDKQFGFTYDIGHHSPSTSGKDQSNPTKSLSENYDYGLGADVFFSSLELQSSSKQKSIPSKHPSTRIRTRKTTAAIIASHEHEDIWINTPSDGSDNLLKAVSEIIGTKKDSMFDLIRFPQDSPEPDSADDEEDEDEDEYHDAPPRTHTGGKWKPEHAIQQERQRLINSPQWDDRDNWGLSEDHHNNEEYGEEDLHPSYTKGKWVPGTKIVKMLDYNPEPKPDQLFNDQYWCTICNRKLASRIIYERHLKSNLHMKRSEPENELEEASRPSRLINDNSKQIVKPLHLHEDFYATRSRTASLAWPSTAATTDLSSTNVAIDDKKRIRKRLRYFVKCEVCITRLPKYLMGKHLISSRYHYRRMKSYDLILQNIHKIVLQSPFQCLCCRFYANTEEMFLKHWDSKEHVNIVESGNGRFWCSLCKFHCEDNNQMRRHLVNEDHQEVISAINRSFPIIIRKRMIIKCEKCHEDFFYNIQLRQHARTCCGQDRLVGTASDQYQSKHKCYECNDVFRSLKALQKHRSKSHSTKTYFCSICELNFTSTVEARKHRISIEHKVNSAKKRKVKNLMRKCNKCGTIVEDVVKLKEHLLTSHPNEYFSCSTCGMKFILSQELSRHIRDKKCAPLQPQPKTYEISYETIEILPTYTIISSADAVATTIFTNPCTDKNTEIIPNLPSSQEDRNEFGVQQQSGNSEYITTTDVDLVSVKSWSCEICAFQSESQSEYLYHVTLHSFNVSKSTKIPCSICGKTFLAPSLRCHLRQHTNERHFKCKICSATFARSSNLSFHVNRVHAKKAYHLKDVNEKSSLYECSICSKSFKKKHILEQHFHCHRNQVVTKTFPCAMENCLFLGRSAAELRNHHSSHTKEKNFICRFIGCNYKGKSMILLKRHSKMHLPTNEQQKMYQCSQCPFKTKVSSHLTRHFRIHDKIKPYKCPYCEYSCNNSENLRKHVLTTKKHPGRYIYECKYCNFVTNIMREYKVHLSHSHYEQSKDG